MHLTAVFTVSLELQGDCSDQLTLICRHDDALFDPFWIHNETAEYGQALTTAFPELTMYSFHDSTEHRVTVTEVGNLTGYIFQCAYIIGGTPIKSNAVQYSFVPNSQSQYITTTNYTLPCCQQFTYRVMVYLCATVTSINSYTMLYCSSITSVFYCR